MKKLLLSMAACSSMVAFTSPAFASTNSTTVTSHSVATAQTVNPAWMYPDWPDDEE